jgi:adenine-specific DNA-methyltransferase
MNHNESEHQLIEAALELGADTVPGWSGQETTLASRAGRRSRTSRTVMAALRDQIRAGEDPLGDAFIEMRTADVRRQKGATYTPNIIVRSMVAWARAHGKPDRIVDPGAGSGRFLVHAARTFTGARLVGVEIDPLAAMIARANLAVTGVAQRATIELRDYREIDLRSAERTLYIGNPPYVRHHLINSRWKRWLAREWRRRGVVASGLAGLHIHFFLATLLNANKADYGAFITAAEWLDVNYGSSLRHSLLGELGGQALCVVEPTALPFPDTATTAAITLFRVGSRAGWIRMRRVKHVNQLKDLSGGRRVSRARLTAESRWSRLTRPARQRPHGFVELGELCHVHRGQATGANGVWIASDTTHMLPPSVLFSTVTKARELITAGKLLEGVGHLRKVVDLPLELERFDRADRQAIERFLREARRRGAHESYIARHRRVWWAVGLRAAAPILATYMARRAPVFTRNLGCARHLNIAHGLYPRETLDEAQLLVLVDHLSAGVSVADGRTYAGGLTKFEPREMERLWVPRPVGVARA